ncbi:FAD-binding oxidoreductase [Patescibacteria group bacterium]
MVVKILDINQLTHDVKSFVVEKPQGFTFTPGQATEVSINKSGWEEKKRPFTFTSLSGDKNLEFVIKGYPLDKYPKHGGVTEEMHKLVKGDELIIDEAWGAIKYIGEGIFIAGGAGITPFIAIIRQLKSDQKLKGNKLFFSNKEASDVILESELKNAFGEYGVIFSLTREKKDGYENGRIDKQFIKDRVKNFSQKFYVCGPKQMVKDVNMALEELEVKPDFLVFEK